MADEPGLRERSSQNQSRPEATEHAEVTAATGGTGVVGVRGVLDARRDAAAKAVYRASSGTAGTPPLANLQAQRTQGIRVAAERILRKGSGAAVGANRAVPSGSGSTLSSDVRARLEPKLGADLSPVRVHTGADSAQAASQYGARAFTVGNDVHFNQGEFSPGTKEGDRLLAHELTHVVQGRSSNIQRKSEEGHEEGAEADTEVSHPDEPAEKEADSVADHVTDQLHADGDKDEKHGKSDRDDKDGKEEKSGSKKKAGDEKSAAKADEKSPPKIAAKLDSVGRKVWAKVRFYGANYLDARSGTAASKFPSLAGLINQADTQSASVDIEVNEGTPAKGKACFNWGGGAPGIIVQPIPSTPEGEQQKKSLDGDDVAARASELSHEMQHAADAFHPTDAKLRSTMRGTANMDEEIHGEWRAYAQQAKTAADVVARGQKPPSPHRELLIDWKADTFEASAANRPQSMFANTSAYMYKIQKKPPTKKEVEDFINAHRPWVTEAFGIFPAYTKPVP